MAIVARIDTNQDSFMVHAQLSHFGILNYSDSKFILSSNVSLNDMNSSDKYRLSI